MGDTASWFYKTRLPEIAREHNCSLEEAEKLFMLSDHHKIRENNPEKYGDTHKRTPDMKEAEVELEEPVLFKLMLMPLDKISTKFSHISQRKSRF